jgi:hypothetical protein
MIDFDYVILQTKLIRVSLLVADYWTTMKSMLPAKPTLIKTLILCLSPLSAWCTTYVLLEETAILFFEVHLKIPIFGAGMFILSGH